MAGLEGLEDSPQLRYSKIIITIIIIVNTKISKNWFVRELKLPR
jgi:hypothetical protein